MTTEASSNAGFLYEELSYQIIGILIEVHKELGAYAREKQYADLFEKKIKTANLPYKRELAIGDSGNILDFLIDDKIIVEFKTVAYLVAEHYDQVKRYLHQSNLKLGILVNFRDKRLHPKRVLNINNLQGTR
jgi:GxxExxY protein